MFGNLCVFILLRCDGKEPGEHTAYERSDNLTAISVVRSLELSVWGQEWNGPYGLRYHAYLLPNDVQLKDEIAFV